MVDYPRAGMHCDPSALDTVDVLLDADVKQVGQGWRVSIDPVSLAPGQTLLLQSTASPADPEHSWMLAVMATDGAAPACSPIPSNVEDAPAGLNPWPEPAVVSLWGYLERMMPRRGT